jgi:hypothetical protein
MSVTITSLRCVKSRKSKISYTSQQKPEITNLNACYYTLEKECNIHVVTMYGGKECTCYCVWEEGMYTKRGRKKCTRFYLARLGGRNVLCCYCVRVKEMCMLPCLGGRNVPATVSGFVPLSPILYG